MTMLGRRIMPLERVEFPVGLVSRASFTIIYEKENTMERDGAAPTAALDAAQTAAKEKAFVTPLFTPGPDRTVLDASRDDSDPHISYPSRWSRYAKQTTTPARRIKGPFDVMTREGAISCEDGWLAVDSGGWPYPIAADEFDRIYKEDTMGKPIDQFPDTPDTITEEIMGPLDDDAVKRAQWLGAIVWQDGPIKVNGVNGLQVDDVMGACLAKLESFYEILPDFETQQAIGALRHAMIHLTQRTAKRTARGVEGTDKA